MVHVEWVCEGLWLTTLPTIHLLAFNLLVSLGSFTFFLHSSLGVGVVVDRCCCNTPYRWNLVMVSLLKVGGYYFGSYK